MERPVVTIMVKNIPEQGGDPGGAPGKTMRFEIGGREADGTKLSQEQSRRRVRERNEHWRVHKDSTGT
jgi:hypothetical protein